MLDENIENKPTEEVENNETSENLPKKEVITDVIAETTEKEIPEAIIEENETSIEAIDETVPVVEGKESVIAIDENTPAEGVENIEIPKNVPEKEVITDAITETAEKDTHETIIEENENSVEVTNEIVSVAEEKEPAKTIDESTPIESKTDVTPVPTKKEVIAIDYKSLNLEELVAEFQKLLKNSSVHLIKNDVEEIKTNFNQKFGELLQEKKKVFLEDGGNEIDFQYHNPIKSQYNDLLFEYKVNREKHYKEQKEEQQENLTKRLAVIEEIKALIDNAEPSSMYKQFREMQIKWQTLGKIPHANYNDVWRTYHHHVERFYDLLHLNNDFRDLDFKHNLDEKLKLVEKANALTKEPDTNKAFKELQILHRLWKEDIGPVAKEFREDVWGKFSAATKIIHNKRHDFQKNLESKYEDNVALKEAVITEIHSLLGDEKINSHSVWQQKIKDLEALRQKFFKIGKVPRANNDEIWDAFKKATADFNRQKNVFYKDVKKVQQTNLDKKRALVEKAEALKDNDDWDATTPIMKQIQSEWKSIGHVPRKYSDTIWKSFKNACNHYFDKLHGVQDEANKGQIEVFNKKKEMLDGLKSQADTNEALSLDLINSYVSDWKALGEVPFNMRHIESKFNKFVDRLYDKLDLGKNEVAMLRFKNLIANYIAQKNFRKVDDEQLFVRKKIDEINKEIQQLENNIGFFSNTSGDNPLLKNVRDNISKHNDDLIIWKEKLSYIRKLEY